MKVNKYGLALHTTTPELGLAMSDFDHDTRSQVWNLEREMSSHLHQYLIDFIKPQRWKDMAFIAVAKGPGGFTGTRIGMVTARTFGQQLDIPVFAVSTLAAFAFKNGTGGDIIAVQMPAQRGQVFGGVYQLAPSKMGITTLLPDSVFTPEAWHSKLSSWEGSYNLVEAKFGLAATVTSILQLAYFDWEQGRRPNWSEALPFYGQHPVHS
ncbi:MAG: tRNA (adenosine(37)-N6)-threonylcarbamoyltransferase complex dimerization subunit type 1 TsaB [Calothrix sp. C42_A2020_038]|nr:tRNA (adenosine(37)-N6)-threonylcarbamoyltransferase complex dimerization subunit type 1 TsaB [Calothrix sp. C42_A2020_038]